MARPKFKPDTKIPTPEEAAAIRTGIDADPDAVRLDKEWFERARPAREVVPRIVERYERAQALKKDLEKSGEQALVSIVLDKDIADYFQATGPGWMERVNQILRRAAFGDEARS